MAVSYSMLEMVILLSVIVTMSLLMGQISESVVNLAIWLQKWFSERPAPTPKQNMLSRLIVGVGNLGEVSFSRWCRTPR